MDTNHTDVQEQVRFRRKLRMSQYCGFFFGASLLITTILMTLFSYAEMTPLFFFILASLYVYFACVFLGQAFVVRSTRVQMSKHNLWDIYWVSLTTEHQTFELKGHVRRMREDHSDKFRSPTRFNWLLDDRLLEYVVVGCLLGYLLFRSFV